MEILTLSIPPIKFPILMNIYSPVYQQNNLYKEEPSPTNNKSIHTFPSYTKKEKRRLIRSNSWSD